MMFSVKTFVIGERYNQKSFSVLVVVVRGELGWTSLEKNDGISVVIVVEDVNENSDGFNEIS